MSKPQNTPRLIRQGARRRVKILLIAACALMLFMSLGLVNHLLIMRSSAREPVDTFLVLGGSIRREIYVSQLATEYPQIPIIISKGSDDPCIVKLFERNKAPSQGVWLEKCANSTFGNYMFSQPLLTQWGARHVKILTSDTHLPRAQWMAKIMLGAHGIWPEMELVEESGIPGNTESLIKTILDLSRAILWAFFFSQIWQPSCSDVVHLREVDMASWCENGFTCEYQGGVDPESLCN